MGGAVLSWGSNLYRQCGRNFDEPLLVQPGPVPLPLEQGERVLAIHAGGYRGTLVTSRGRLLTLGLGVEHEQPQEAGDEAPDLEDEGGDEAEGDEAPTDEQHGRAMGGRAPGPDVDVEPDNFEDDDEF